jgi:hypothetical protein
MGWFSKIIKKEPERPPLWTPRIGFVTPGLWIIHTSSGQIGQVKAWTDKAIVMTIHGSTNGNGEDKSAQGFDFPDNKDNFRMAAKEEISTYVHDGVR